MKIGSYLNNAEGNRFYYVDYRKNPANAVLIGCLAASISFRSGGKTFPDANECFTYYRYNHILVWQYAEY